MSEHVFNTWFAVIVPLDESDNLTLKLAVRDQFARDWLQEHYGAFLHQELQNLEGQSVAVDWVIEPSLFTETDHDRHTACIHKRRSPQR